MPKSAKRTAAAEPKRVHLYRFYGSRFISAASARAAEATLREYWGEPVRVRRVDDGELIDLTSDDGETWQPWPAATIAELYRNYNDGIVRDE